MKTIFLLCAVVALAFAHVRAAEPIEGAFGFKFGQEYQPTTPIISHVANGFVDVYKVEPPMPNPAFEAVYVKITPQTHLIYEIIGVGKTLQNQEGVDTELGIKAYLQRRYGDGPNLLPTGDQIIQPQALIVFYMSSTGNHATTTTTLLYRSLPLYGQATDQEHVLRAEQEAAHVQQALKTIDGAGL